MPLTPKFKFHEAKGMLADMSTAQQHPETLRSPDKNTSHVRRVMHLVHRSLYSAGVRLDTSHDRKQPEWSPYPIPEVIGYGGEKIAYKVEGTDGQASVISVYHKDSLTKNPDKVLEQKREHYDTYLQYFGNLVLPTEFTMVDNPWGDGEKPASVQAYLENTTLLSELTPKEISDRTQNDSNFTASLEALKSGYRTMISDGLCPDFASSNVIVTDSGITLFDTGVIYPSSALERLKSLQPNYSLIESI